MTQPRRRLHRAFGLRLLLLAVLVGGGVLLSLYVSDMRRAYARIEQGSELLSLPSGEIEYAERGSGIPVLVVHGSGGGFDQGLLIGEAVLGEGFRLIVPSRFGYLRSALPAEASFQSQAQAFVELLDRLQIDRVAVVAMSHGGPAALWLAAEHPQRVSSLVLISAGVTPLADVAQAQANERGEALTLVFSHDPLYWAVSRFLRGDLIEMMGADPALLANLGPAQRELVDALIESMNPVAPRAAGVQFDHRAMLPGAAIAAIQAPTLIFHARDDGLQRYANAEFAAEQIAGAELRSFERGGHLLLAVEQAQIRGVSEAFLRRHRGEKDREQARSH